MYVCMYTYNDIYKYTCICIDFHILIYMQMIEQSPMPYSGSIKALSRLFQGSIKALLRLEKELGFSCVWQWV
jgi:hypothetical protein